MSTKPRSANDGFLVRRWRCEPVVGAPYGLDGTSARVIADLRTLISALSV